MCTNELALTHRLARSDDLPVLHALVEKAIDDLQRGFLTPEQIVASHHIMGVDTTLIEDGTYFIVKLEGQIAGCGGWSKRATLYGGDQAVGRDASLLDPATQPARVRAMYTDPGYVRRGIGRMILGLCELVAGRHGFRDLELMATMSGQPLYTASASSRSSPWWTAPPGSTSLSCECRRRSTGTLSSGTYVHVICEYSL